MKQNHLIGYGEYSPKIKAREAALKGIELGLAAVQLSGDFLINFPENILETERQRTKEIITLNNINLHFHSPSDIPLASRHEPIRQGGLQRLEEYIDLAVDLGASSFIFHPGRFAFYKIGSGKIVFAEKSIPKSYYDRFYNSTSRLVDYADGRIQLLLENTYLFTKPIIDIIDKFLEKPFTGLVWDIAHIRSGDGFNRDNENHIAQFFSDRLKSIKLAHIHDAVRGRSHLPLGAGSLDIVSYIDIFRNLNIEMIIEVLSDKDLQTSLEFIESLELKKQI